MYIIHKVCIAPEDVGPFLDKKTPQYDLLSYRLCAVFFCPKSTTIVVAVPLNLMLSVYF